MILVVLWHINHYGIFNATTSLYVLEIYDLLVLWHINHCGIFNATTALYVLEIYDLGGFMAYQPLRHI